MRFRLSTCQITHFFLWILLSIWILGLDADPAHSTGFTGPVGDNIDYYSGTLSLSDVDATVPGRHGLDVVIQRTYSSMINTVSQVDSACQVDFYRNLESPEKYRYLGQGWHIGFPFMHRTNTRQNLGGWGMYIRKVTVDAIVQQDGSEDILYGNIDTLTMDSFPRKTLSQSLCTAYGPNSDTPDSLLLTDGTRWIFGYRAEGNKFLTRIVNIYGDVLQVEYHTGTRWIKKVTSPIGRWVKFRYGNRTNPTALLPYDDTPSSTARLYELHYLNWNNDTLRVKYRFTDSTSQSNLQKVIYATGDSCVYSYTNQISYQTQADWDSWCTSGCSTHSTDTLYYLSQFTNMFGSTANWKYKYVNRPVLTKGENTECGATPDDCLQYNQYVSVIQRWTDNDTLNLRYRICKDELAHNTEAPYNLGSKTIATTASGTTEEFYFFVDQLGGFNPEWYASSFMQNGGWPTALFQMNSIVGTDTQCVGYDYNFYGENTVVAVTGFTMLDSIYLFGHYPNVDTVKTIFDSSIVYSPARFISHTGVPYYKQPATTDDTIFLSTGEKRWTTSETVMSKERPDLAILQVQGARIRQRLGGDGWVASLPDSLDRAGYYHCSWSGDGSLCSTAVCSPTPLTDTIPFSKDSLVHFTYVPTWNLTLVDTLWHYTQLHGKVAATFEAFEYDPSHFYLLKKKTTYLDTRYLDNGVKFANDTAKVVEQYSYNSAGNLTSTISASYDTTYYEYDDSTSTFLTKVIDPTFGSSDTQVVVTENSYYPNGQLKWSKGIYNDTGFVYYDTYGRVVRTRRPMESDSSSTVTYDSANRRIVSSLKIDSGLFATSESYKDEHLNLVKTLLRVSDTLSIVDTMTYDRLGSLMKSARPRYSNDTVLVWTENSYDQRLRRYKTTLPGGTLHDSVRYIDEFTTDYRSAAGLKTRVKTDFVGNAVFTYLGDSSACETCFSIKDTAAATYNAFGKPLTSMDYKGLSRSYSYDGWGRRISLTHPDIGTQRVWYDRVGRVRIVRSNTNDTCTYFKYDRHGRLIEEGTVPFVGAHKIDTAKVNDRNYPDTSVYPMLVLASYRYDDYSSSQIAADTSNGLGYCLGNLTEVVDSSGYTYYYYDKRGRVGLKTTFVKGLTSAQKLRMQYYANDALKRIVYPDSSKHSDYSYYRTGQVRGISDIIGLDSIAYQPWGTEKAVIYKNGLRTDKWYDDLSRLTRTKSRIFNDKYFSRAYSFDTLGYLHLEVDVDTAGNATTDTTRLFSYDRYGRLTSALVKPPAIFSVAAKTVQYKYDMNNNIVARRFSVTDTLLYTANTNFNSKMQFRTDSAWVFTKDNAGRVTAVTKYNDVNLNTAGHIERYRYDYRNLLTRVTFELPTYYNGDQPDSVINLYDATGHKVKQIWRYQAWVGGGGGDTIGVDAITPGGGLDEGESDSTGGGFQTDGADGPHWENREEVKYYIWAGNRCILELNGNSTLTDINIYGLGRQLAHRLVGSSDSLSVLISDYQGSVRSVVPFNYNYGARMPLAEYYPYGELAMTSGSSGYNRQFIGKEMDKVHLPDFGPRYYNPTAGHFMSPDPILSAPSAYVYTNGNPIMQSDPTGLEAAPYAMAAFAWNRLVNSEEYNEARRNRFSAERARQEDLAQRERELSSFHSSGFSESKDSKGNVTIVVWTPQHERQCDGGNEWGGIQGVWVDDGVSYRTYQAPGDRYPTMEATYHRHMEYRDPGQSGSARDATYVDPNYKEDPSSGGWIPNGSISGSLYNGYGGGATLTVQDHQKYLTLQGGIGYGASVKLPVHLGDITIGTQPEELVPGAGVRFEANLLFWSMQTTGDIVNWDQYGYGPGKHGDFNLGAGANLSVYVTFPIEW